MNDGVFAIGMTLLVIDLYGCAFLRAFFQYRISLALDVFIAFIYLLPSTKRVAYLYMKSDEAEAE